MPVVMHLMAESVGWIAIGASTAFLCLCTYRGLLESLDS